MWLTIGDKNNVNIVNLDFVESTCVMDPAEKIGIKNHRVVLYVAGDGDPYIACEGSLSKCQDYMNALMEYVGGKKIVAVGEHCCECPCGCQKVIREDYLFCDDCQSDDHWNKNGFVVMQLKKDAV